MLANELHVLRENRVLFCHKAIHWIQTSICLFTECFLWPYQINCLLKYVCWQSRIGGLFFNTNVCKFCERRLQRKESTNELGARIKANSISGCAHSFRQWNSIDVQNHFIPGRVTPSAKMDGRNTPSSHTIYLNANIADVSMYWTRFAFFIIFGGEKMNDTKYWVGVSFYCWKYLMFVRWQPAHFYASNFRLGHTKFIKWRGTFHLFHRFSYHLQTLPPLYTHLSYILRGI